MMKRFITGLLILIVGIGGVFAVDPVGFDVYTEVTGINLMKITTAEFTGTTKSAFTAAEVYEGNDTKGNHKVTAEGEQTISAWISTLLNSRAGYSVELGATPMTSTIGSQTAYINYTVTVNTTPSAKTFTTNGANTVDDVVLFTTGAQSAVTSHSYQIGLSVDADDFAAAVEGEYTGTVTFTWITTT